MNSYELLGRERKVAKLLMALDAINGHPITEAEANKLSIPQLREAVEKAEIKTASAKTIAALVERIRMRDAMKGDAK